VGGGGKKKKGGVCISFCCGIFLPWHLENTVAKGGKERGGGEPSFSFSAGKKKKGGNLYSVVSIRLKGELAVGREKRGLAWEKKEEKERRGERP